jgi:hypothetical protein
MPARIEDGRPAGEGDSHKARMYVPEESDSGVVPMNHSNNDGKPPAESEEGRLLIKENTLRPSTYPTQSGFLRVPRAIGCAACSVLSRQSSEIRAVCANERPYGSERGAIRNGRPYRDRLRPNPVSSGALSRQSRTILKYRPIARL